MGLYRTDYIIYGWKLPYDLKDDNGNKINLWDDKFLPYIEGHKGVQHIILRSDMATMFGLKISKDNNGWGLEILDIPKLNSKLNSSELNDKFKELFGFYNNEEPYLFIHSHYA